MATPRNNMPAVICQILRKPAYEPEPPPLRLSLMCAIYLQGRIETSERWKTLDRVAQRQRPYSELAPIGPSLPPSGGLSLYRPLRSASCEALPAQNSRACYEAQRPLYFRKLLRS